MDRQPQGLTQGGGKMDSAQRDNAVADIRRQLAIKQIQDLMETMTEKCYKKCVTYPSSSLSRSEQTMTEKCYKKCVTYPSSSLSRSEQTMTEKCYKKCVTYPSSSLSRSEQKCISLCSDRYEDTMNVVSKTFMERLQKEQDRR